MLIANISQHVNSPPIKMCKPIVDLHVGAALTVHEYSGNLYSDANI